MEYLAGFILAGFLFVTGISYALARLYRGSSIHPAVKEFEPPPEIRSHALISFSIVLPFATLSFLVLTFSAMKIASTQGAAGHTGFIAAALLLPALCFLLGYF